MKELIKKNYLKRNTKAISVLSPRLDCSLVLNFPIVEKHLSASTEDVGIPSKAL